MCIARFWILFSSLQCIWVGEGCGARSDAAPTLVDWDGDSDFDVVVGDRDGTLAYFERVADGSPVRKRYHQGKTRYSSFVQG